MRRTELYGEKHFDVLVSMHNLSMVHHAAGREDAAIELQEKISRIGEELGITEEGQKDGMQTEGARLEDAIKLTREEGKRPERKTGRKGKQGGGDSATAWKPGKKKK